MSKLLELLSGKEQLMPVPHYSAVFRGFLGGTLSIFILLYLSHFSQQLWIMAPFGASCVLLYAAAQSPLAQPRNVIFGHFISAAIGLFFVQYLPVNMFTIALAVGLSIAGMQLLQCVHPPAGANPLVILLTANMTAYDWGFLFFPVLIGAIALVVVAYLVNNFRSSSAWPLYGLALWKRVKKEK